MKLRSVILAILLSGVAFGQGIFGGPQSNPIGGVPGGINGVQIGDVNGDGCPDLVVSVGWLPGNCAGLFSALHGVNVGNLGFGDDSTPPPSLSSVALVNLAGHPAIVDTFQDVSATSTNNVPVMLSDGAGNFQAGFDYNSGYVAMQAAGADLRGIGLNDLLIAVMCDHASHCSIPEGYVYLLLNNGDGTFPQTPNAAYDAGNTYSVGLAIADMNGDGHPDFVVLNQGLANPSSIQISLNNGDGTFHAAYGYLTGGYQATSIATADLRGIGKQDIIVVNGCSDSLCASVGNVAVFLANGDGSYASPVFYTLDGGTPGYVTTGNVDGSGRQSLLATTAQTNGSGNLDVLISNGDGTFQPQQSYPATTGGAPTGITAGDLNQDGKIDVAISYPGGVSVLLNTFAPPTVNLTSSVNPAVWNQPVTYSGTVGNVTGTITFKDGAAVLGTLPVVNGGASVTIAQPSVGTHNISAIFNAFGAVASNLTEVVTQAATTLALSSTVNPSFLGTPVTFVAGIAPQAGGTETGSVVFKDGSTVLATVSVAGNTAQFTTSALKIATHPITATYSGDANYVGSTNGLSEVVGKALTSVTLVAAPNPALFMKPVTFTATINSLAGVPTGYVNFYDGATLLLNVKMAAGKSSAIYGTSKLTEGIHNVTAQYLGDTLNSPSTSIVVAENILIPTTLKLSVLPNPSLYGQAVTFTAQVPVVPDGEIITFSLGTTVLGTGLTAGGIATFTVVPNWNTGHVQASYASDNVYAGSLSNTLQWYLQWKQ